MSRLSPGADEASAEQLSRKSFTLGTPSWNKLSFASAGSSPAEGVPVPSSTELPELRPSEPLPSNSEPQRSLRQLCVSDKLLRKARNKSETKWSTMCISGSSVVPQGGLSKSYSLCGTQLACPTLPALHPSQEVAVEQYTVAKGVPMDQHTSEFAPTSSTKSSYPNEKNDLSPGCTLSLENRSTTSQSWYTLQNEARCGLVSGQQESSDRSATSNVNWSSLYTESPSQCRTNAPCTSDKSVMDGRRELSVPPIRCRDESMKSIRSVEPARGVSPPSVATHPTPLIPNEALENPHESTPADSRPNSSTMAAKMCVAPGSTQLKPASASRISAPAAPDRKSAALQRSQANALKVVHDDKVEVQQQAEPLTQHEALTPQVKALSSYRSSVLSRTNSWMDAHQSFTFSEETTALCAKLCNVLNSKRPKTDVMSPKAFQSTFVSFLPTYRVMFDTCLIIPMIAKCKDDSMDDVGFSSMSILRSTPTATYSPRPVATSVNQAIQVNLPCLCALQERKTPTRKAARKIVHKDH